MRPPGDMLGSGRAMDSERETIGGVFREERARMLATLIRLLGDIDRADEGLASALEAALVQWPTEGTPGNPRAWLIRTARNKAVDSLRRGALFEEKRAELKMEASSSSAAALDIDEEPVDDRLRLIFTCCHPALAIEAQVALTLRTLGGLETEAIARAFLVPAPTMAQRLVRAKAKIRQAGIPYRVPDPEELPARLEAVLVVIYLVFNEGYAASSGIVPLRREICEEAIRLGRLLVELMPAAAEARALLALMLLQDARREARVDRDGGVILLEDQDRSRWDQPAIREGLALIEGTLRIAFPGPYALQAAIAGVHAQSARAEETDWTQIAGLYTLLDELYPSPVVALNKAVAIAMVAGPAEGLRRIDALAASGALADYHLLPAARADLLRRLGRWREAAAAYRQALALAGNQSDRRFLQRRLIEVTGLPGPN
ncbi:MAG TPA: RNA polymerase sigma factor [Polyangia bacterium]|nr:RNA polymerase sigma factor [Polyangia bacterium]